MWPVEDLPSRMSVLALVAAAEFTVALGLGQGYRAARDSNTVVAARISDRRSGADPFLLVRAVLMACDSSGAPECHRAQSAIAGLLFHPAAADWFGVAFGAGLGRISAFSGQRPTNSGWTPGIGDLLPVLGAGLDIRISISGPFFARFDAGVTAWPTWPFKSLVELDGTAGLGVVF